MKMLTKEELAEIRERESKAIATRAVWNPKDTSPSATDISSLLEHIAYQDKVIEQAVGIGGIQFENGNPLFIETDGSEGVTSRAFPELAQYLRSVKPTSEEVG